MSYPSSFAFGPLVGGAATGGVLYVGVSSYWAEASFPRLKSTSSSSSSTSVVVQVRFITIMFVRPIYIIGRSNVISRGGPHRAHPGQGPKPQLWRVRHRCSCPK